jgi:hypothetical protein
MKDRAKRPPKESKQPSEAQLDEEIEETFPASDPPATSPTSAGGPRRPRAEDDRRSGEPPQARR